MSNQMYVRNGTDEDPAYAELAKVSNVAALSPEERIIYEENLRIYRDNLATNQAAFDEGHEAGVKEGMKRMVTNMSQKGFTDEAIADATGLSIGEVRELNE